MKKVTHTGKAGGLVSPARVLLSARFKKYRFANATTSKFNYITALYNPKSLKDY